MIVPPPAELLALLIGHIEAWAAELAEAEASPEPALCADHVRRNMESTLAALTVLTQQAA